jgi:beta-N-acetylhexosaminidase
MADLEGAPDQPQVLRVWVARGLVLAVAGFAGGFLAFRVLDGPDAEPAAPRPAQTPSPLSSPSPAPAQASAPSGADSLQRDIGQKIVTRMAGAQPSRRLLQRVYRGEVGGVILFSRNAGAPAQVAEAVSTLQQAASRGGNPRLLIAVDQEGGAVRRLPWAPPNASAAELGADPANAFAQGEQTGRELRRVGINLDLAPVLDVPAGRASFLGSRAFGQTTDAVSRAGCAFAAGVRRGGVLTAGKHFPGLGYATANTDDTRIEIRASAPQLRAAYGPYRACLASLSTVMVSNAAYPALGAREPAVLSRTVVEDELRGRLGFRGVVISDSLEARAVRHVPELAARAARAGVDLLVYPTTEAASSEAYRALLTAARAHPSWRRQLKESARRIRALKAAALK